MRARQARQSSVEGGSARACRASSTAASATLNLSSNADPPRRVKRCSTRDSTHEPQTRGTTKGLGAVFRARVWSKAGECQQNDNPSSHAAIPLGILPANAPLRFHKQGPRPLACEKEPLKGKFWTSLSHSLHSTLRSRSRPESPFLQRQIWKCDRIPVAIRSNLDATGSGEGSCTIPTALLCSPEASCSEEARRVSLAHDSICAGARGTIGEGAPGPF